MEVQNEIMQQQLDTAHSLHQKTEKRIKELECELIKTAEEKNQISLKLQEALTDLENERSSKMMPVESKDDSIICLLEAKVAELGNKIDEVLRAREHESEKQNSFLYEKLTSLLEKIKSDVKSNAFISKWDEDDIQISITFFEKAVNIICQGVPQFETLLETVAQHGKLAKHCFKQVLWNIYMSNSRFNSGLNMFLF